MSTLQKTVRLILVISFPTRINEKPGIWEGLGRIFLLDHLEWEKPTLNLVHTLGDSPHKRTWDKEAFAFCLLALTLTSEFIYPALDVFLQCQKPLPQDYSVDYSPAAL